MSLERIRALVEGEAGREDWKFHILPVVYYAKLLAEQLGADLEITELAALLHDIGRLRHGGKDHEITGVAEAESILEAEGYPAEVISEIKHCVASHRGSKDTQPETLIAKIIANADAMAHFDVVPWFFHMHGDKDFSAAFQWVDAKMQRDREKKLTLPEAKVLMKEKYDAINLLLGVTKEYF